MCIMQLWPKIAKHFRMETGPNLHINLVTMMNTPEKKDLCSSGNLFFLKSLSAADLVCAHMEALISEPGRKVMIAENIVC